MKHIEPTITCLMTIHMKPYAWDALESISKQTRLSDVAVVVIDSGQWIGKDDKLSKAMENVYLQWHMYPWVDWYFTGEPSNFKDIKCPVAYWLNYAYESGLIKGKYFCTFYDDDKYKPQFFEKMAGYLDSTPEAEVVRCSQEWIALDYNSQTELTERRIKVLEADRVIPGGEPLMYAVDGGQIMMRREVLDRMDKPLIPNEPDTCRVSDGAFLNNLSNHVKQVDALPEILYTHRFTPISTYTKSKDV